MTRFLLALFVRLLPDEEWRRAMLAEFAALEHGRGRFAVGCVRAVLSAVSVWTRLAGCLLVAAVLVLLITAPGSRGNSLLILGVTTVICFVAMLRFTARPEAPAVAAVSGAAGLVWWAGLLVSEPLRANPQWALLPVVAATVVAGRGNGAVGALGAAFVTCLAVFFVAALTYAALPELAPYIAPSNATDPVLENRIEAIDPYVAELLLAALLGLVLRAPRERRLPG
jgi:hypothetical protein